MTAGSRIRPLLFATAILASTVHAREAETGYRVYVTNEMRH
jgi:hypothetical protein